MCVCGMPRKRELKDREGQFRASLLENFSTLRHCNALFVNINKQSAKTMLVLSRNRLRVLTGCPTRHCHFGKDMAKIGLNQYTNCRSCGAVGKSPEHLTSNSTAITENRVITQSGKNIMDKGEIPALKPLQLLLA